MKNHIAEMLEEQRIWKQFEKCLKPILNNCESCKEYGICKFHEDWYYQVKESFKKCLKDEGKEL